MNKTEIRANLHIFNNKLWNKNQTILGFNIAYVAWHGNPWKVLHNNKTFNDATATEPYESKYGYELSRLTYEPIATFKKQNELVNYLHEKLEG